MIHSVVICKHGTYEKHSVLIFIELIILIMVAFVKYHDYLSDTLFVVKYNHWFGLDISE